MFLFLCNVKTYLITNYNLNIFKLAVSYLFFAPFSLFNHCPLDLIALLWLHDDATCQEQPDWVILVYHLWEHQHAEEKPILHLRYFKVVSDQGIHSLPIGIHNQTSMELSEQRAQYPLICPDWRLLFTHLKIR